MNRLTFAAVADDDTGASDLAGMLAGRGVRTLLVIDLPAAGQFHEWSREYSAVVMAEATRNLSPDEAERRTREAIRLAETRSPRVVQVKYCSTFDSTSEGNIGPSIDAALHELGEEFTIALPALPVNGRTTYLGHHFVHDQLLSDSPMRHHPLTPMTNPNLVDHLSRQTRRRVGLAPYSEVEAGARRLNEHFDELRRGGVEIAVVDCLNDAHLETICRAASDLRLITGSSAFGIHLPAVWRERGWIQQQAEDGRGLPEAEGLTGCLIVAGSCSVATITQNEWLAARGGLVIRIDPRELLSGSLDRAWLIDRARAELAAGRPCLLATSANAEGVRKAQEWGAGRGLTLGRLGEAISYGLAGLAAELLESEGAGGLIAAGGETSGALCRTLGLGALSVGRNIEPGVPLCLSLGRFRMPVVLKSGNFGSGDFYYRALRAIARPKEFLN